MRFLLFLILIRFHYVRSDCNPNDFLLPGSSCNDDNECKTDPSGKYSFADGVYYCSKGVGDRQCCLNRDQMCMASDAKERSHPLTKATQAGHPEVVLCHENADCQKAQGSAADNFHCFVSCQ
ncbi:hypothetical protein COOONC_02677 [Cooperia oncophora]